MLKRLKAAFALLAGGEAWVVHSNWMRFRGRMQGKYREKREARFGTPPLYPFGVGEECPGCRCVYDDADDHWQISGCHCVCHD